MLSIEIVNGLFLCAHVGESIFAASATGANYRWCAKLFIQPRSGRHGFDLADY